MSSYSALGEHAEGGTLARPRGLLFARHKGNSATCERIKKAVTIMAHPSKAIVLVVEDDATQRWFGMRMVEDAGFEAIEAGNADEAGPGLGRAVSYLNRVHRHDTCQGARTAWGRLHCDRWPPVEILPNLGGVWGEGCYNFPRAVCSFQNHTTQMQSAKRMPRHGELNSHRD